MIDPAVIAAQYAFYSIIVQAAVTLLGAVIAGVLTYLMRRLDRNGQAQARDNKIQMNRQDVKLESIHDDINGRVAETIAVQVREQVRNAVREALVDERARVAKIKKEE